MADQEHVLLCDKDEALKLINHGKRGDVKKIWKKLSPALKKDVKIAKLCIQKRYVYFQFLDAELKENIDIIREVLLLNECITLDLSQWQNVFANKRFLIRLLHTNRPYILDHIPEEIRHDFAVMDTIILFSRDVSPSIPKHMLRKRKTLFRWLKVKPSIYMQLPEHYKDDEKFLLCACSYERTGKTSYIYQAASESLRNNKQIFLNICKLQFFPVNFAGPDILNDTDLILEGLDMLESASFGVQGINFLCENYGTNIEFMINLHNRAKINETVSNVIRHGPFAQLFNEMLVTNRDFVVGVIEKHPSLYDILSSQLQSDPEIRDILSGNTTLTKANHD